MNKTFFKTEKGHLGQYEDWWSYNDQTDQVTHSWDHVRVGDLSSNKGSENYSSSDFLAGDHHAGAKTELKKLLDLS